MIEKAPSFETVSAQAIVDGQASVVSSDCNLRDRESLQTKVSQTNSPTKNNLGVSRLKNSVSFWGFVDQGVVSVASFSAAAIVGRVCGSEEFGIYSLAMNLFWLVAGVPNALVWTPYTTQSPRLLGQERQQYTGSALVHTGIVSLCLAAAFLLVGLMSTYVLSGPDWLLPMCLAILPLTLLMMGREHLRRVQLAHMNTLGLLLIDLPIAVMQIGIILLLANYSVLSFSTALLAMALPCLWGVVWLIQNKKQFQVSANDIREHWQINFQFGRWLLLVSVAWLLGDASFRWLVVSLHGRVELGLFSAAMTTVMFLNPVMLTVQNLARSFLANEYATNALPGLLHQAKRGTLHMAWIFGLLFAVLAVVGGELVQVIFGAEYAGLEGVVALLCLGLYLHVLNFPIDAALSALENGQGMLASALVRLTLILVFGVPFIAWYGSLGVGIALATGSLGTALLQWTLFLRRCQHVG